MNNKNQFILAGNFYPYRTQWGHCDASMGLIIQCDPNDIIAVKPYQSGLYLNGDVRNTEILESFNHRKLLLVAANDQPLQLYEIP